MYFGFVRIRNRAMGVGGSIVISDTIPSFIPLLPRLVIFPCLLIYMLRFFNLNPHNLISTIKSVEERPFLSSIYCYKVVCQDSPTLGLMQIQSWAHTRILSKNWESGYNIASRHRLAIMIC